MPAWRLNPLAKLSWRHFDGEWVVFDEASGLTHAMSPLHAAVLTCLERASHDDVALARALASEFDVEPSQRSSVQQVIEELNAQGLVEAHGA